MRPKFKNSPAPATFFACLLGLIVILTAGGIYAETKVPQILRVIKGKSIVVSFPERIKTISIANEAIIDVAAITPTDAVVIGKDEGITSLYIWGESGRYQSYEAKVDRSVTSQQIVLDVQIAEVNRAKLEEYGVDWLMRDWNDYPFWRGDKTVGSYAGGVSIMDPKTENLIPQQDVSTGVVKWIGNKATAQMIIQAMQEKGDLQMLANPRLVCLSNEEASFLVGGEIPVPISQQSSGGGGAITIQWKEYGVRLRFTPNIVDSNLIRLKIAPEVSSLDYSNAVSFAGWTIPSMRTRKVDGTVELNSTQAIVLGGLKSTEVQESVRRVPVLGHIPILSFFFSKKHKSSTENELLIVVSPRVIETAAQEIIPPLPGVDPASDK